jgi:GT2 family glycosyltransferase
MNSLRLAVLITCHNRVDTTILALSMLYAQVKAAPNLTMIIFLVDDGSTDGTGSQVRAKFPTVNVIEGDGSLYWNGGMCRAYEAARVSDAAFDAYLLLNDDVILEPEFLNFLSSFANRPNEILVGSFRSEVTDAVTYSGFNRSSTFRPFTFEVPQLSPGRTQVDTFNGNAVLIPASIFEKLGGLDPAYKHALGDLDFGLRAKAAGIPSFVHFPTVGICERGPSLDERIVQLPLRKRAKLAFGFPNGIGPYMTFAGRYGRRGLLPVYLMHTLLQRAKKVLIGR